MMVRESIKLTWAVAICVLVAASAASAGPTSRPATLPDDDVRTSANPQAGTNDLSDLSLEDLMNVQVTSVAKKAESIAQAPAAITVIDQDAISRSGFSTIPDLLRLAPGMDVARINSYTWAISARGKNDQFANDLLVLQDGRTLYSPITSGVNWDTVDYVLEDLERIEVIRGPGATLWGSNAVNGVINITSKDARDTQGALISTLGSNDDSSLSVRYGGKLSQDTFYRVYVKGKYDQGFPAGVTSPAGLDQTDHWYSQRIGFRIDKHASDNDSLTLQGDLANNQLREPTSVPILTPPYNLRGAYNGSDSTGNMLGRWNHKYGDNSDFSLQVYYDYLSLSSGTAANKANTIDIDFHDRFMLGTRNEVTWGAGYRFYRTETPDYPTVDWNPTSQNRNLFNLFIQDTFAVVPDHLHLTVGSKLEHNDFTGFELEPSARLLWTPDNRNSVWAAVSRATRSPVALDESVRVIASSFPENVGGGVNIPAEVQYRGNPDFDSEHEIAYEIGYRVKATSMLSVDVSAYYDNYTNLQSETVGTAKPGNPIIIPLVRENGARGEVYGAEISANLRVTQNWRLNASYSMLRASFGPASGSNGIPSPPDLTHSAPQNQAQLHSYLDITRNLQFNAGIYYEGAVDQHKVPAYISTDLNLAWQPRDGLEVKIGVLNLIDNRHPEFGTTGNQGYADQVPRTFYAQLTARF